MAFIPAGVAAQPRPNILAVIFAVIFFQRRGIFGMSGKSFPITGYICLLNADISPDFSAIFIIPHQTGTIPHIVKASCTASFPAVIT